MVAVLYIRSLRIDRVMRHSERAAPAAIALQLVPERKRAIMIGPKPPSGKFDEITPDKRASLQY